MRWLLATTSPHKLAELRAVLGDLAAGWDTIATLDAATAESLVDPVEDADTFEGNAVLKARGYAEQTGRTVVADDSGIEVDAIGGRPGVRSARYSGVRGSRDRVDPANNAKLLDELAGVPLSRRGARYVCVLAVHPAPGSADHAAPGPTTLTVRGELEGRILLPSEAADPARPAAGRGSNGFGYDPLFVLPDGRTAAELEPREKDALSHRGAAARSLLGRLNR
ncbi:non-canonical purine NTP pyrophosphatase [Phycisphaera mikurensis]|uniref:dITP/XTP pyrophosphatase n=1 Tax=Phycisphaera mikurensis (strain NBRC 102666 / KCTC 22515 / FYK2301M01) TaxID=1142394 RepID=I0IH21_PHYMF|nr:non-canonical purine NTP pyrophosphatase [Phycisphaera mikurensis]MBB6440814.1 XTP/dITP diphosphohydrolase [Phycisphaera mikurensis]BAM04559.1 nucleoside-triphosphatase [Phycisphaera mikurensis NBRC 102666]